MYNSIHSMKRGSATAEILFGLANPCGKTAETFPFRIEDTLAYATYPGNGSASWYAEGVMVGYRYYDSFGKKVLFPFGYGLSYTSFEYSDLKISPENINEGEQVAVCVKIKNTGSRQGKETVQLYVRDRACHVIRPDKELKAFEKISLRTGEVKEVKWILGREAFAYFNSSLNTWHVEPGAYQIMIGASSRDIRLAGILRILSDSDLS